MQRQPLARQTPGSGQTRRKRPESKPDRTSIPTWINRIDPWFFHLFPCFGYAHMRVPRPTRRPRVRAMKGQPGNGRASTRVTRSISIRALVRPSPGPRSRNREGHAPRSMPYFSGLFEAALGWNSDVSAKRRWIGCGRTRVRRFDPRRRRATARPLGPTALLGGDTSPLPFCCRVQPLLRASTRFWTAAWLGPSIHRPINRRVRPPKLNKPWRFVHCRPQPKCQQPLGHWPPAPVEATSAGAEAAGPIAVASLLLLACIPLKLVLLLN